MKQSKGRRRLFQETIAALAAVALFFAICTAGGYALMPQRSIHGSVWSDYLAEPQDSVDVLFFGSSRVYCNVIPGEIYRQSGITSFVMAGPSQTLPVTYYYLREALRTQSPSCVFVELSGAFYRKYESYSLANISYMPFHSNRFLAAMQCEPEIMTTAVFPLETFHYRLFAGADAADQYAADRKMLCGYTPLETAQPQTPDVLKTNMTESGQAQFAQNVSWLKKIAGECAARGIPVVFFYAPTCLCISDADRARLEEALSGLEGVTLLCWYDNAEELGINLETDWYDALHLNTRGARTFSDALAEAMLQMGLQSRGQYDRSLWEERGAYRFEGER